MRPLVVKDGGLTTRDSRSMNQYLNELKKIDILTPNEENEIATLAAEGDQTAINKLVKHNLRFVVSVAKQYSTVNHKIDDLINEGNLGLITAAKKFDPTKGFKFISYAVWHIRQRIILYIKDNNTVRIPSNKSTSLRNIKKLIGEYLMKNENIPMGFNEETEFLLSEGFSQDEINFYRNSKSMKITSFDAPLSLYHESSNDFITILEDTDTKTPDSNIEDISERTKKEKIIFKSLNQNEKFIIQRLFGFNDYEPVHLTEIATDLNLPLHKVRHIKNKAIRKIQINLRDKPRWLFLN